jgi:serine/threonine protein kinase
MAESLEFEHYQLLTNPDGSLMELGRGAMGVTYKAFDTNLHCYVALKVIAASLLDSENAAERFLREARVAARLRHRNVASVFHLGKHGDSYFYAMEFIDGETVLSRVKREGPLECVFALDIAQQVACALIAAEEQQLVHRDIKPSNLMLVRESDGEILVKVIDFGLVKSAVESSVGGNLTVQGFVGTPYFASPEQLDRQPEDIRSDIYSLGITLWYMLMGKPTFMGSMASVIAQHLEKTPAYDSLAILPAQVVAVLRRMLEKDKTKRVQTPRELRLELRSCIESLSIPRSAARTDLQTSETFETIELTSVHTPELRPESGALLKNRYRLIEDVNPANPGRIFHAEDIQARMRVTVRIFLGNPEILAEIDEEAGRVKAASHPNFIQLFEVKRERNLSFIVLEWLEGFPLVDLLRARRALTQREMLMLLKQIAPAVDAAREGHLNPEMNLRDIFLHFPESFAEPVANIVLRCPLDEWPAFVVKLSLLGRIKELEASSGSALEQTVISDLKPQRDVVQLGILAYELLGGKPGSFAPLANVSEKGNEVLRKCLTPDRSFSTAAEFYDSLQGVATAKKEPLTSGAGSPEPERLIPPPLETPIATNTGGLAAQSSTPASGPKPASNNRFWPVVALLTVCLLAAGATWIFMTLLLNQTPNPEPQSVTEEHQQKTNAPLGSHPPPQPGKPWTNSLDMRFVPLGNIYMAAWQTRVADFEAFVKATGYDAVGGMSSAVTQNGFKLNEMSWKAPGFQQTPDHPIVGVSWEDANQFCAWLTKKERREGTLETFQSYRLPTDREWSRAVGLEREQGNSPMDRSGKIKGVYPWGTVFPPPNDSGNYAGSESAAGAPEAWNVIPGFHDEFPRTAPVSAFKPNARGLCCIGGNVWEWCMDKFEAAMNWRTLRGGSWATSRAEEMLSSFRRGYGPLFRCDDVGFRCVVATDGAQE